MSLNTPLYALIEALQEGFSRPAFLWQVVVFAVAVIGGTLLARVWRTRAEARLGRMHPHNGHALEVLQFSVDGVQRLAFPLTVIGVMALGLWMLRLYGQRDERLLRLALLLFAALAAIRFCVYVLRRVFSRSAWLQTSERTLAAGIWIGVALHATGLLGDVVQWLETTTLALGRQHVSLWVLVQGAIFMVATVIAALWGGSLIEGRLLRAQSLERNLRIVLARLAQAVLLIVAVLLVLTLMGIDLTVLSVFGGALGVGLGQRVSQLPEVPTIAEAGGGDTVLPFYAGLAAPAGTPRPIIDRISAELKRALAQPDLIEKINQNGLIPAFSTPEQLRDIIEKDVVNFGKLVKEIGITPQ